MKTIKLSRSKRNQELDQEWQGSFGISFRIYDVAPATDYLKLNQKRKFDAELLKLALENRVTFRVDYIRISAKSIV